MEEINDINIILKTAQDKLAKIADKISKCEEYTKEIKLLKIKNAQFTAVKRVKDRISHTKKRLNRSK